MDPELVRLYRDDTPKLNARIARGYATEQIPGAEKYLDDVFRSAARGFPPGLEYAGWQRCTPDEEFSQAIRKRNPRRGIKKQSKKMFETSISNVFLVKYMFRLHGELLPPCYMYLPYVTQGGGIKISGSSFNISPVLADRVISIGADDIFVRFLRDRITFKRHNYSFKLNDAAEKTEIIHSPVYKGGDKGRGKKTVNAYTSMTHYLFCKYGFYETFKKYAGCVPIVGNNLSYNDYPPDQWYICKSSGIRPRGFSKIGGSKWWEAPIVNIAIRKDEWNPMVKALVSGFFYVADHLPELMTFENHASQRQWIILMGHILFSGNVNYGRLVDNVTNHLESLDEYVDHFTRTKMLEIGVDVENFYDFAALILLEFDHWLLSGADKVNSMYDKELSVNYYVLFNIITEIFGFHFGVKAAARKGLERKAVENLMSKYLRAGFVFRLRSGHGEISSMSYSGDNMAFKITSTLIPQSSSTRTGKSKKGDRGGIDDPSKRMHISVAEVGAYSGMRKSDPSGRSQINLYTLIDHKGLVLRNPELRPILDPVQQLMNAG